ncbi:MAG: class I SAM-dependent methyltransferase [Gemmatimonas sp.]
MTQTNYANNTGSASQTGADMAVFHCTLCGSTELKEVPLYSTYLNLWGNTDARIRRCKKCDMIFLEPYPVAQLDKMYAENYFVLDDLHGGAADGGTPLAYADLAAGRVPKFQSTIDLLKQYVPAPARLMDVGAATGEFADIARRGGYDVSGIELSDYASKQAHDRFGFDFFVGPLEAYPNVAPFDIIHLSHVLEHFVDVHASLDKMNSMLSANGVIYIEVPFAWNLSERVHARLGRVIPFSVWSVHHRSMFRPKTLRAFFAKHGFRCRHMTLTPPNRYPSNSLADRAKNLAWDGLELFGQGLLIEAVFSR